MKVLRDYEIRPTPQRLVVHKMLLQKGGHFTAEEIHSMVKQEMPSVSLATVYTVLDLFKQKHLINEIRIQFDRSCFEARIDPHHHFLCKKCGEIFDLNIKPCKALEEREIEGNVIEELQGYFYGTCRKCLEVENGKPN